MLKVSQVSTTPTQQVNDQVGMAEYFSQAMQQGVDFQKDSSDNYYIKLSAQFSAAKGESMVKVDRQLAEAILGALSTGGRISKAEVLKPIMEEIVDGNRYGAGEAILARLLLAACDDRKTVKLHGDRVNITDAAEKTLNQELHSFWGKLGAKARWGKDDPGVEPKTGPTMQSGGYDT